MQAVIMAGGKGTRLSSITKGEIPKPMAPIKDKPILLWQLEQLKRYGINTVTMIVGYLGDKIIEYFKDGKDFGMEIDYIEEKEPLGTAGAFYYLKDKIKDDYFMLVFGDVFFNIDIKRMEKFHTDKKSKATLFVHPNSHPYDSDLIVADKDDKVLKFDSKNNVRDYWYDNKVNAGLYILDKSICDKVESPKKTDFEKEILSNMALNGEEIYAYSSPEYVKDVGTVDRIASAIKELESGLIQSKNMENKQRAIFLDRDGTINVFAGLIHKEDDFVLLERATQAIELINKSGYLAIVITNQPVVARGLCEIEDVDNIHKKMKTLLGEKGVFLDDVLYCPHHPDRGYPEENKAYKIKCNCRKPDTLLVEIAAERYNIDLENSWMIGDTTTDIEMAKRCKMHSALVNTGEAGNDKKYTAASDFTAEDIFDAVQQIISR